MRWFYGLLTVAILSLGIAMTAIVVLPDPRPWLSGTYHPAQLEADRHMTERMAWDVSVVMDPSTTGHGMLRRSTDPGYLEALERYVFEHERMLGR